MEKELTEVQDELRGMQAKRTEIEQMATKVLDELQSVTVSCHSLCSSFLCCGIGLLEIEYIPLLLYILPFALH